MSNEVNIVFDLDGTLVDSAPSLCKAGNSLLRQLKRKKIDVKTYKTFIGKGLRKQVEQLLLHTGGIPNAGFEEQYALFREFYSSNPLISTTVYPGVYDALRCLKKISAKLAICTQKLEQPARKVLTGLNLEQYFDGFAFGDSLSVMKPNPDTVKFAINGFGEGPLIYIGDSETDSATAYQAGASFLLFSGGYRNSPLAEIKCCEVFHHHTEILPLVKKIINNGLP